MKCLHILGNKKNIEYEIAEYTANEYLSAICDKIDYITKQNKEGCNIILL